MRVKVYGLVPMTRRRYLRQLGLAVALALLLLGLWSLRWPALREQVSGNPSPGIDRVVAVLNAVPWVILAVALAQAVEAWSVLRLFRRRQAAQTDAEAPKSA